jgi:protein-tyrosine-phosphatase
MNPPFDKPGWLFMLLVPLLPPVVLKNVLFICTGNVCRSPMAELLFRDMVKGREDYQVGSAGVGALPGQPASKHTAGGFPAAHEGSYPEGAQPRTCHG